MVSRGTKHAELLDGAELAAQVKQQVRDEVQSLLDRKAIVPCLAAVLVGDDPASAVYVRNKIRACEELGIRSEHHALSESTSQQELLSLIASLNARAEVNGILVQLPLPDHITEGAIIEAVEPLKDVDGFHPMNVGKLAMSEPVFVPCTPAGVIELLEHNQIPIRGTNACVVGRSRIVGQPMAQLLLQRDATVTICHSRTRDLPAVTRQAEILIVAVGRPGLIGAAHIKPGATVIDVGMNKITEAGEIRTLFGAEADKRLEIVHKRGYTLVGDVNPAEADELAGARSPVPGGVGLLTIAMLMRNTLKATKLQAAD